MCSYHLLGLNIFTKHNGDDAVVFELYIATVAINWCGRTQHSQIKLYKVPSNHRLNTLFWEGNSVQYSSVNSFSLLTVWLCNICWLFSCSFIQFWIAAESSTKKKFIPKEWKRLNEQQQQELPIVKRHPAQTAGAPKTIHSKIRAASSSGGISDAAAAAITALLITDHLRRPRNEHKPITKRPVKWVFNYTIFMVKI